MTRGPRLALYAQATLLHTAWGAARLMVGFAVLTFTEDLFWLGLLAAGYAAPAIVLALPIGAIMDRQGALRVLVCGIVVALVACISAAVAPTLVVLILANALLGLGQLLCSVSQQGYLVERIADYRLDASLGNLTSATSVGQLLGPIAATYVGLIGAASASRPNTTMALGFSAACVALALPCVIAMARARATRAQTAPPGLGAAAKGVLATPGMWRALLVSGVVLASLDLLYVLLPAWAADRDISAIVVGWLLAGRAAVTLISRLGLMRLLRLAGRTWLLVVCLALGAIGFALLLTDGLPGAVVAMLLLGVALGLPQPLTISWVVNRAPHGLRGSALGLRVTSNRIVQIGLPLVVGIVAGPLGAAGAFAFTAALLGGAAIVTATAGDALGGQDRR